MQLKPAARSKWSRVEDKTIEDSAAGHSKNHKAVLASGGIGENNRNKTVDRMRARLTAH